MKLTIEHGVPLPSTAAPAGPRLVLVECECPCCGLVTWVRRREWSDEMPGKVVRWCGRCDREDAECRTILEGAGTARTTAPGSGSA